MRANSCRQMPFANVPVSKVDFTFHNKRLGKSLAFNSPTAIIQDKFSDIIVIGRVKAQCTNVCYSSFTARSLLCNRRGASLVKRLVRGCVAMVFASSIAWV